MPDVDAAFNNFDAISYAKGNACLRQLAFWLGPETFFAGVDRHLSRHRFGTATLANLVEALQSVTDRDVSGWVERWLRTTGHDTIRVVRSARDGAEGMPSLLREGSRPHRVRVHGYDRSRGGGLLPVWEEVVDLSDDEVALPAADLVVPNSTGDTFARVVLDDRSREHAREGLDAVPHEHPRVLLWSTLLDEAARAELPVHALVGLVEAHLPGERAAVAVEHVLARSVATVRTVAVPEEVVRLLDRLSSVAMSVLDARDGRELPTALVQSVISAVLGTTHDEDLLRRWLGVGGPAGPLAPTHRWDAVVRLAALGQDVGRLVEEELRDDGSSTARLAALSARAAAPDAAAKRAALEQLLAEGTSNRELLALARGLWSAERRDLVDGLVPAFLHGAGDVGRRGQAMALVVGRATPTFRWSSEQRAALEHALQDHTLPPVLARTWADLLHDQRRTARHDPR